MRENIFRMTILLFIGIFCINFLGCKKKYKHKLNHYDRIEATCIVEGNVEYWKCTICDKLFSNQDCQNEITTIAIEKKGHTSSDWIVDIETDCISSGKRHKECTECHKVLEDETVDVLGHDLIHYDQIEATCTVEGNVEYWKCTICDKLFSNQDCQNEITTIAIEKKEHKYDGGNCISCLKEIDSATQLEYKLLEDGTYEVTGIRTYTDTDVIIPRYHNQALVTSIANGAFLGCNRLKSITLPFVGERLNGSSNTYFGYIFGASSYTNNDSYVPSSLKEVTITSGIGIGGYAFYNCNNIENITIPNSVMSIGRFAFSKCSNLISITIPDSVRNIESSAFEGCTILRSITLPFVGAKSKQTSNTHFGYIFGAKDYKNNRFYVPKSLREVIITGGECIDEYAFYECNTLTNIAIPESVTSIGYAAFRFCENLISISVSENNKFFTSIDGDLYSKDKTEFILYCSGKSDKSVTILNSVTSISECAFYKCKNLESLTLPFVGEKLNGTSNTHFGYIFGASSYTNNDSYLPLSLKEVIITNAISIEKFAFYGCRNLINIVIPDGVTNIGSSAFEGCSSLVSIKLPYGIESIERYTFRECSHLENVIIPEGVTSIGYSAFNCCYKLESIIIPNSVTDIEMYAFSSCVKLTSIDIPEGVANIGESAFGNCKGLTNIKIPNSVISIGKYAFKLCVNLTNITIPNSIKRIESGLFYECERLTSIVIPENVTSIGYSAFSGCSSLISIVIPDSVTSIEECAFYNCTCLTEVIFENPYGWQVNGTMVFSSELSNASTAAKYLANTYSISGWKRS